MQQPELAHLSGIGSPQQRATDEHRCETKSSRARRLTVSLTRDLGRHGSGTGLVLRGKVLRKSYKYCNDDGASCVLIRGSGFAQLHIGAPTLFIFYFFCFHRCAILDLPERAPVCLVLAEIERVPFRR